jgi:hypothetical protein
LLADESSSYTHLQKSEFFWKERFVILSFQLGLEKCFAIPYDKVMDDGKRVHPDTPLYDGTTDVRLYIGKLSDIIEKE